MTGNNESSPEIQKWRCRYVFENDMTITREELGGVVWSGVESYNVQAQTQENRNDTFKGLKLGLKCKLVPPDFTRPM